MPTPMSARLATSWPQLAPISVLEMSFESDWRP